MRRQAAAAWHLRTQSVPKDTGHVRGAALSLCRKAEQEVLGSGPCLCGQISASRFW